MQESAGLTAEIHPNDPKTKCPFATADGVGLKGAGQQEKTNKNLMEETVSWP